MKIDKVDLLGYIVGVIVVVIVMCGAFTFSSNLIKQQKMRVEITLDLVEMRGQAIIQAHQECTSACENINLEYYSLNNGERICNCVDNQNRIIQVARRKVG